MKRLWKCVPPCLSDVQGFQTVLSVTDGMGIVDDPSKYKPFHVGGTGKGGKSKGGKGKGPGSRVVNSDIRNADVITGTEEKLMEAYRRGAEKLAPSFVLLSYAPSSSMISSDLYFAAERIAGEGGVPAAYVNIDGSRDYLYGISVTLEAMGRLLLGEPENGSREMGSPAARDRNAARERRPKTLNLLGMNPIDWTDGELQSLEKWIEEEGFRIVSRWGMRENTENLRRAGTASMNLVVNVAGLRLARYMEAELGIPYIVGAPFGRERLRKLFESPRRGKISSAQVTANAAGDPAVLVIGEQLTACAIRDALSARGYTDIRVLSFYEMDRSLMQAGDAKLASEDDLKEQLEALRGRLPGEGDFKEQPGAGREEMLVIGDPDLMAVTKRSLRWIPLQNGGSQYPITAVPRIDKCGEALDSWLDLSLAGL